jgi:lipid-binding SYLF domain-containing protein
MPAVQAHGAHVGRAAFIHNLETDMNRFIALRASRWLTCLTALALLGGCATPDTRPAAENEVRRAEATLQDFRNDPDMTWFRDHFKDARAILIAPNVTRAGFVFGGSGGQGIVLARQGGQWVGPAFYKMGAGSVGFQIGVDVSEVVVMVMSEKGVNALLSPKFTLGADASIAAGPVGAGAASSVTADFVSFARSKGVYAGVSLGGAVITPDDGGNAAFYGRPASPVDILVRRNVNSPAAQPLRQQLTQMSR